jgi:hypothetical protein
MMENINEYGPMDTAGLPVRLDRRMAARVISRRFFPISHRTLERWPLTWRRLNGRALVDTVELLAEAQRRVEDSAATKGGVR